MGWCLNYPSQGLIPSPHSIHMHTLLLLSVQGTPSRFGTPSSFSSAALLDAPAHADTQTNGSDDPFTPVLSFLIVF